MPISEFTKKLVETKLTEYCDRRIPMNVRDQMRLTFKMIRDKVTLIEERPYHRDPSIWTETPIAQFRFDGHTGKWSLYRMDRNLQWHPYDLTEPSADFDDMLKALDNDKTGIFWG